MLETLNLRIQISLYLIYSFFFGKDLVQTWIGPGSDLQDPVWGGPGPGPCFHGPDLEVQVRGPQNLPRPDPDRTVDSVHILEASFCCYVCDMRETTNYKSIMGVIMIMNVSLTTLGCHPCQRQSLFQGGVILILASLCYCLMRCQG